jgi:hypothetical protein
LPPAPTGPCSLTSPIAMSIKGFNQVQLYTFRNIEITPPASWCWWRRRHCLRRRLQTKRCLNVESFSNLTRTEVLELNLSEIPYVLHNKRIFQCASGIHGICSTIDAGLHFLSRSRQ